KLSAFQEKLLELIESNALKIENDARRNEVLSFVRGGIASTLERFMEVSNRPGIQGAFSHEDINAAVEAGYLNQIENGSYYTPGALKDLSISRSSFTWGVPVPEEVQRKAGATQRHVVYVWLDALTNYMTAIGYGSDAPADAEKFAKFWPADLHLVGKEITRFHCVYWPAFLMAAELPLPKAITAHGWLLFDNSKMSKSKGNIVRTETILEAFGEHVYAKQFPDSTKRERDLFASDVLRYFLLREIPFGQDGSFSFDAFVTRYNADLANGYGNLVSRTLNLIQQNFAGLIPAPRFETPGDPTAIDTTVVGDAAQAFHARIEALSSTDFTTALTEIAAFITTVDGFISAAAPWKLAKDPAKSDQLATVLYVCVEAIRWITGVLHPYCPAITARVWTQLGLGRIADAAQDGELNHLIWGGLKPGTPLGTLAPIFPRAEKSLVETMINMENENAKPTEALPDSPLNQATPPAPTQPVAEDPTHPAAEAPIATGPADSSPQITIDDFAKVELRIAQVLVAERIPKADKLLRLEVDLGYEKRQILSGIAEHYTPEELVGRRIIVITNLAPRKMRGLESHGMLLAASEEGGKPFLATVPEGVPLGTRLK
ncbi:MAG: methionine--tRNA ligase subunit beta, partial [Bryocella sp.]